MKQTKYLIYNYLIQAILIILALQYFKTWNNMFLNFSMAYVGFLAALLSKVLPWVYIALQFIILLVVYFSKWRKVKTILALTIISTFFLGWVSILNAIVIIYLMKNK